ncbi:MAG: M20/M25/M40 family metallo-hydrolase [Myxococcales bacterium]|nr:MAG: M20/M25/M40 family metallo-hydrolase [Myxococcales bacterium]
MGTLAGRRLWTPITRWVAIALLLGASSRSEAGDAPRLAPPKSTPKVVSSGARSIPERLVEEALQSRGAVAVARELSDLVGARPTGSPAAERALVWAESRMRRAGLQQVRREAFDSQAWTAGGVALDVIAPAQHPLRATLMALSGSDQLVEGEVVRAGTLEELQALQGAMRGKVLLIDARLERTRYFDGFVPVARLHYRAVQGARLGGARAVLLRSAGTGNHRLAHMGNVEPSRGEPNIPVLSLAAEDADLLTRLSGVAPVRIRARIGRHQLRGHRDSNVVGELLGWEKPEEVVLLSAHWDSWADGTGAQDDAAGCGIVLDAARAWTALSLKPRRTLRIVLFGSEELNGAGAFAYATRYRESLPRHVAALEADSGAGAPIGYLLAGTGAAQTLLEGWVSPLASKAPATIVTTSLIGPDLVPLQLAGVPVLGVAQDLSDYFEWHHTAGDTFDKIDPAALSLAAGAWSALAWSATAANETLPPPIPPRF